MRHCCSFKADDIYYLKETDIYNSRKLSVGYCPICQKPVAELLSVSFSGKISKISLVGIDAHKLVMSLKNDIVYSMKECNYLKFKAKPFGWKYGINKTFKIKNKEQIKQYACDFYGNKEIIKII